MLRSNQSRYNDKRWARFAPRGLAALWLLVALAAVIGLGWLAARPLLARSKLSNAIQQGIDALASAESFEAEQAALADWEAQTAPTWRDRRDALIDRLLDRNPFQDRRTRALLRYVAGVDFGDRVQDWQRWREDREQLREGQPPQVSSKEAVRLQPRWTAPVGLTSSATLILPIDRAIYVGSQGAALDQADDLHDGIVRVDALTGISELVFEPPERGQRDVVGLAAGSEVVIAATRGGWVYAVQPDGKLLWKERAGRQVSGDVLTLDITRDNVADVVVPVDGATLVCLNGATGRGLWRTALPQLGSGAVRGRRAGHATLVALGELLAEAGPELLATTQEGGVFVLSAQNGRIRWQGPLQVESLGGPICVGEHPAAGPLALLSDASCGLWTLSVSGAAPQIARRWSFAARGTQTTLTPPRFASLGPDQPTAFITCVVDRGSVEPAGVALVAWDQLAWRQALPGELRAAPAIANLNSERGSELLVASVIPSHAGGPARGQISVLSRGGRLLKRVELEFGVEAAPVVFDVDGDGRLDVLVADQAGLLHCFATDGRGPVEWGLGGGDIRNARNARSAYSYGQTPVGYQWKWKPE